ncbi:hypothetical protein ANTPLA_LOCUS521 [Anthophora plagiata]
MISRGLRLRDFKLDLPSQRTIWYTHYSIISPQLDERELLFKMESSFFSLSLVSDRGFGHGTSFDYRINKCGKKNSNVARVDLSFRRTGFSCRRGGFPTTMRRTAATVCCAGHLAQTRTKTAAKPRDESLSKIVTGRK